MNITKERAKQLEAEFSQTWISALRAAAALLEAYPSDENAQAVLAEHLGNSASKRFALKVILDAMKMAGDDLARALAIEELFSLLANGSEDDVQQYLADAKHLLDHDGPVQ